MLNDFPVHKLQFYLTSPYPCSYLPDRMARSQVATPAHLIDTTVYSELIRHGFRRSGSYVYRPLCDQCRACVPVRLIVAGFKPGRTQRRACKRHEDLEVSMGALRFDAGHYALYRHYQSQRHAGGGMDQDGAQQYRQFLLESAVATRMVEFRENGALRMVSVIDQVADGLSAVYTFYEPEIRKASFGTYNILWQAALCRELGLPYLYLGYWIKDSPKMAYKYNFQPLQGLIDGRWQSLPSART